MRLSTLGRYALRAMVDLALHQDEGPVQRQEIVERQELSSNYLAQLFVKLRQAGLVVSVMGPGGGYRLARDAAEISAGDVLRAVDESLEPVFCVDPVPEMTCPRVGICVTHVLWKQLGQHIIDLLDSVTLEELCRQERMLTGKEQSGIIYGNAGAGDRRLEWRRGQFSGCTFIGGAGI